MGYASMAFHMLQCVEKMLPPIRGSVIGSQEIYHTREIALDGGMPELNQPAVIAGMSTEAPEERIAWKGMQIEQTGARTQESRLLDNPRSRAVELALRITERDHRLAQQVLQPFLPIMNLGKGLFLRQPLQTCVMISMAANLELPAVSNTTLIAPAVRWRAPAIRLAKASDWRC